MKRIYVLLVIVLVISCFGSFAAAKKDESQNGPLLDRLLRYRRQSGGINYGFPTFPNFSPTNFPNIAAGGSGGLFSRGDFFIPDTSQFKGNQVWITKSCVYDEKGKEKCVEQHGDKPKQEENAA